MSRFELALVCLAASMPCLHGCVPVVVAGAGGAVEPAEPEYDATLILVGDADAHQQKDERGKAGDEQERKRCEEIDDGHSRLQH